MITRYVLVRRDDTEEDYEYEDLEEAKSVAARWGLAVIERQYEFSDTDLVWTPDGSGTWPPDAA